MVGAEHDREIALGSCDSDVVLGSVRKLDAGWYLLLVANDPTVTGVIVNKESGNQRAPRRFPREGCAIGGISRNHSPTAELGASRRRIRRPCRR